MSEQELFVEPYVIENDDEIKTAETDIPVDAEEWPKTVKEALVKKHPYLGNAKIKINFKKVDESNQVGLGTAIVKKDDKKIHIPVMISEGKLRPFDVMIHNDKPAPLTEERVKQIFSGFDIVEDLVEDDHDFERYQQMSIYDEQLDTPGYSGTGVKTSSLLPSLNGRVYDEHLEMLKESTTDPIALKFGEGEESDYIKIALALDTIDQKSSPTEQMMDRNIFHIKEASPNKLKVLSASRNVYKPKKEELSYDETKERLKEAGYDPDSLDNLTPKNPLIIAPDSGNEKEVKEASTRMDFVDIPGEYEVIEKGAGANRKVGYVFPDVFTLDGEKTAQSIIVTDDKLGYQDNIVGKFRGGVGTEKEASPPAGKKLKEGRYGFFYYDKDGHQVATEPFKIDQIARVEDQKVIYAESMHGKQIRMIVTPNIQSIVKQKNPKSDKFKATGGTVYFIPESMTFCGGDSRSEFADNPASTPDSKEGQTFRLYFNQDGTYEIEGDFKKVYDLRGQDKVPADSLSSKMLELEGITQKETVFILSTLGIPKERAQRLTERARHETPVKVAASNVPETAEKTLALEKEAEGFIKDITDSMRANLIKEAAVISNIPEEVYKEAQVTSSTESSSVSRKNSIDSILSLALVNEENVEEFVNNLPIFQDVLEDLSRMLIFSRLGFHSIPEDAVKNAMRHLDKVVNALKELKAVFS